MNWPDVEALKIRVRSQASVGASNLANEIRLLQVIGVVEPAVRLIPISRLNASHERSDSFVGSAATALSLHFQAAGLQPAGRQ
jgi:hypothetical protein